MYDIKFLPLEEWEDAIGLAYKTFLEYDAPDFAPEGIQHFREFVSDNHLRRMFESGELQVIGAYDDKLIGMIALKNNSHISLLFVDGAYHRHGIGSTLLCEIMDYARNKLKQEYLTVNSSPFAVDFYHNMGFENLKSEIVSEGIRYTPMKYML